MIEVIEVKSSRRSEFIDITDEIQRIVEKTRLRDGLCVVYVPHTTAAVTINEGADPSVKRDILIMLEGLVPRRGDYHHMEGNSDAHIKASLIGTSETVLVEEGRLLLGTWQSVYFCEFDGPRQRKVCVKISS